MLLGRAKPHRTVPNGAAPGAVRTHEAADTALQRTCGRGRCRPCLRHVRTHRQIRAAGMSLSCTKTLHLQRSLAPPCIPLQRAPQRGAIFLWAPTLSALIPMRFSRCCRLHQAGNHIPTNAGRDARAPRCFVVPSLATNVHTRVGSLVSTCLATQEERQKTSRWQLHARLRPDSTLSRTCTQSVRGDLPVQGAHENDTSP